jgi:hypothetical protein
VCSRRLSNRGGRPLKLTVRWLPEKTSVLSNSAFGFLARNASLIGSVLFAGWLLLLRRRARALVAAGRVTSADVVVGFWGGLAVICGSGVLLWLLQTYSGYNLAVCLMAGAPRAMAQWAAWLIMLSTCGVTLWWVYARGGADVLARLEPAFSGFQDRPSALTARQVRLGVLAIVALVPAAAIFTSTAGHLSQCNEPSNPRLERP